MTLGGSSLFTGITAGLTNTYSLLAGQYPSGLTLSNLSTAMTNPNLTAMVNPTFASYIQTNFSSMDTNGDGILSATELTNMTNNMMSQGLTQSQLSQLGSASGMSGETLAQVLDHFNDIDSNHDGKVTSAEIQGYKLKSAEENKKTEFANRAAANMSVFYGDDDASSTANNASSLLSYKYMNNNNSSNGSSGTGTV